MIVATYREPFAGWAENVSAAGLVTWPTALGFSRQIWGDPDVNLDIVPVDVHAHSLIVETV